MKNNGNSRYDLFLSELLIPISIIFGGLSIYLTFVVSMLFFPLIAASAVMFGASCMGLNRMRHLKGK